MVFGAFAAATYLIIYKPTYFGVTISDRFISVSLIFVTSFTSPILSHKNGIIQATALFPIFSQF